MSMEQETVKDPAFVRSPDFKTVYANWIQGAYTAFDISILAGEAYAPSPAEPVSVELKARLVISPLEAKFLVRILRGMIASHERQYGPINIPAGGLELTTTGDVAPVEEKEDSEGD